jgi:hypothetical protein
MSFSSDNDDDSLEYIIGKDQRKLKHKAQTVVFQAKTRPSLYKEARTIDRLMEKAKVLHHWNDVYYFLLLYVEIALKHTLHKSQSAREKDWAAEVLRLLGKVEKRIPMAKRGMTWQCEFFSAIFFKSLKSPWGSFPGTKTLM